MDEILVYAGTWLRVNAPLFAIKLIGGLVVLSIGGLLAAAAGRAADAALMRSPMRSRALLVNFIARTARTVVIVFAGVVALSVLGLDIGPLIAGIGISGFIVGFAFKDSLSNLAAGLLLLFYQPFEVGDHVEVGGASGTVRDMSVAATEIQMPDGRLAIVPNSRIWNAPIINFDRLGRRRIEWSMSVPQELDIGESLEAMRSAVTADPRVLSDPSPQMVVANVGPAAVDLIIRAWVHPRDVEEVASDLRRSVKESLDR